MKLKRIILLSSLIALIYFGLVTSKNILINYIEQQADSELLFRGDFKKSIKYYDLLIWLNPLDARLFRNRGNAFNCEGQYACAIADYNKALEIANFDCRQTNLKIALAAKNNNDLYTEELALIRLLKLSKNISRIEFGTANYYLGLLEFKKGNFRKAINYYNNAQYWFPWRIYHRANAYYSLGKLDSAMFDLKTAIKAGAQSHFIKKNPNSIIAKCDTCYFPFGTNEFEQVTEFSECQSILSTLNELKSKK